MRPHGGPDGGPDDAGDEGHADDGGDGRERTVVDALTLHVPGALAAALAVAVLAGAAAVVSAGRRGHDAEWALGRPIRRESHHSVSGPSGARSGDGQGPPEAGRRWGRRTRARARARAPTSDDVAASMVLFAVALQSGCGVVEAIEQVALVAAPLAGAELSVVAAALRWGVSEDEAWREVSAAWARTAMALRLAREAGMAPSSLLLSGSEDLRSSRLAEVDVAAARLGVHLVVPLGVAFLPAFVLTTIVPVVLALARQVLAP